MRKFLGSPARPATILRTLDAVGIGFDS